MERGVVSSCGKTDKQVGILMISRPKAVYFCFKYSTIDEIYPSMKNKSSFLINVIIKEREEEKEEKKKQIFVSGSEHGI